MLPKRQLSEQAQRLSTEEKIQPHMSSEEGMGGGGGSSRFK